MSDIAITFPVWPFLVAIAIATLLALASIWWARRAEGLRRWLAAGLAILFAAIAAFLVVGTFLITS